MPRVVRRKDSAELAVVVLYAMAFVHNNIVPLDFRKRRLIFYHVIICGDYYIKFSSGDILD